VLLGVAVAIVYKAVPQLPQRLWIADAFRSTLLVLLLEIDAFTFFAMALTFLAYFSGGSAERRLLPKATERVQQVTFWAAVAGFIVLAILGLWLAIRYDSPPRWIRLTLAGCSVWWALNIGLALKKIFQTSQKARKLGVSVPRFIGSAVAPDISALITSALLFLLGLFPFVALAFSLKWLDHLPIGWLFPVSAATQALVLGAVVATLMYRVLRVSHQAAFQNLERAIVVEDLEPVEIKSRFVTQLLGTSTADWVVEAMDGIRSSDAKLRGCAESVRARMPEVESIDTQYALERKGRATKLIDELKESLSEHQVAVQRFSFKLVEYAKVAGTSEEQAMMNKTIADLQAWRAESKDKTLALATDLINKLKSF
jgi:hypothetical protein